MDTRRPARLNIESELHLHRAHRLLLGRIPQDRLYPLGLNILKIYPEPYTQGLNYNLETVHPH